MPKKTNQLKLWNSEFGDAYTDRNAYGPHIRLPAFQTMLEGLELREILEVGCNRAYNLETLAMLNPAWNMTGIEPNEYARNLAVKGNKRIRILPGDAYEIPLDDELFDLVFTANVLIHISLQDLPEAIHQIYRLSRRYILIIEYFAEEETEIFYRGHSQALWKRNFRKHFETKYPSLRLLRQGFWDMSIGFDDSNWWLWEKSAS